MIKDNLLSVGGFKVSLAIFVTGTMSAALSSVTAYLAQYNVHMGKQNEYHKWKKWTFALVMFSYACFSFGAIVSILSVK